MDELQPLLALPFSWWASWGWKVLRHLLGEMQDPNQAVLLQTTHSGLLHCLASGVQRLWPYYVRTCCAPQGAVCWEVGLQGRSGGGSWGHWVHAFQRGWGRLMGPLGHPHLRVVLEAVKRPPPHSVWFLLWAIIACACMAPTIALRQERTQPGLCCWDFSLQNSELNKPLFLVNLAHQAFHYSH